MKITVTKSYILQILPNTGKLEDIRYNASRYKIYLQHFVTQLYYNSHIPYYSTMGMGSLANIAQKQAMGVVKAEKAAAKELDRKSNCPQMTHQMTPAIIQKSLDSSFDYWIRLNSQWKNKVKIPAKSHRKLNQALKAGFKLSNYCEIFLDKNNKWYVRVFVTKEVERAIPLSNSLGIDVGIAHGVTRSDNYLGQCLKPIIMQEKKSQAERQRQGHLKKKNLKTKIKQLLDVEVNRAITRCKRDSCNLVVENPKIIANLRSGKLSGWARCYFANRAEVRCKEESICLIRINPAYTSITCPICGLIDKRSRVNQSTFKCVGCGYTLHADKIAARNIALKGQERINKYYLFDKIPVRDTSIQSELK